MKICKKKNNFDFINVNQYCLHQGILLGKRQTLSFIFLIPFDKIQNESKFTKWKLQSITEFNFNLNKGGRKNGKKHQTSCRLYSHN